MNRKEVERNREPMGEENRCRIVRSGDKEDEHDHEDGER